MHLRNCRFKVFLHTLINFSEIRCHLTRGWSNVKVFHSLGQITHSNDRRSNCWSYGLVSCNSCKGANEGCKRWSNAFGRGTIECKWTLWCKWRNSWSAIRFSYIIGSSATNSCYGRGASAISCSLYPSPRWSFKLYFILIPCFTFPLYVRVQVGIIKGTIWNVTNLFWRL